MLLQKKNTTNVHTSKRKTKNLNHTRHLTISFMAAEVQHKLVSAAAQDLYIVAVISALINILIVPKYLKTMYLNICLFRPN